MRTVKVKTDRPYDVIIGDNILFKVEWLKRYIEKDTKLVIITDSVVGALYGKKLVEELKNKQIDNVHTFVFPNGERSKNIETLREIYSFLIQHQIARSDLIIALGGGVVGDIAGLVAATYLCGMDYIQIPTTLISQTDSSVGGKTAVNLGEGKNLMGLFYQPRLVICDVSLLKEPSLIREGIAEAIKYALLADKELFELLEQIEQEEVNEHLDEIVERCVKIKAAFVKEDERDRGKRQLLNLGHTIAHGIEKKSGYRIAHGVAVGIGMAIMLSACVRHGLLEKTIYERYVRILEKFDLPISYEEATLEEVIDDVTFDKKRSGDKINIVVCKGIGDCEIKRIQMEQLFKFLNK